MRKRIVSCAMAFLMVFTLMPCSAFAGEASAEGQAESLEAERPAEDDAFGEGGLDNAFFAEDADSLIGTLEADEESAAFAVSAVTGIYLDQTHGDDANDGLTKDTAVQTIAKANELADANGTRDIFLASVYQVTGTENWDLGGKTIHRYKLGGYMIELKDASASLTLKDVVIDGAEYSVAAENAAETDSIIKAASGGTIELKSGAILENNKAAQFGSGILANNGVKITMEKELERLRNLRKKMVTFMLFMVLLQNLCVGLKLDNTVNIQETIASEITSRTPFTSTLVKM